MEEIKKEQENPEKMSYEQLEGVAHQLSEQARQLHAKLQEANMENIFKRLDYLFEVVKNSLAFDEKFVEECTKEIVNWLTLPEKENTEEE